MQLRWGVRGATHWRDAASLLATHGFQEASPLPFLPAARMAEVTNHPVRLPPLSWMGNGTLDYKDLAFLACLTKHLDARTIFEFGTFTGVTAWTLAANSAGVVHTLDLPPEETPKLRLETRDQRYRSAGKKLFESIEANVVQHWGDSATHDLSSLYGRCDLVFVDGAHSYEYVASDTARAFELLAPRGVIVWDDYSRNYPGVVRFLNELDRPVYRTPGLGFVVSGEALA